MWSDLTYIQMTLSVRQKLEELLKKKVTINQASKEIGTGAHTLYKEVRKVLSQEDYDARRYDLYSAKRGQEIEEQKVLERLRK